MIAQQVSATTIATAYAMECFDGVSCCNSVVVVIYFEVFLVRLTTPCSDLG